eukprot:jgi/Phyca11/78507/gw1.2.929.1
MSVPFIKSLQELVASGGYGDKKYPLQKIQVKIERSKDRYIFGPFCWKKILESDAPALLFTAACNTVAGSPIHVDHGRVVSYIPPCAQHCFKIWLFYPKETARATRFNYGNKAKSIERRIATAGSEALVQRPGDVVCLNNLVFHAVLLVYRKNTKRENKSGGIFGDVIVRAEDRWESFRYATK